MQRRSQFRVNKGITVLATVYFPFDVDATHRINVLNILPHKASASLVKSTHARAPYPSSSAICQKDINFFLLWRSERREDSPRMQIPAGEDAAHLWFAPASHEGIVRDARSVSIADVLKFREPGVTPGV